MRFFLIHLSAHLYHHHHSNHPSLLHCFTPGRNLRFQQILPTSIILPYPWTASLSWDGTGLVMLLDLFLIRFFFNFYVCPVWWTKLATRQLFTARFTQYRIVCEDYTTLHALLRSLNLHTTTRSSAVAERPRPLSFVRLNISVSHSRSLKIIGNGTTRKLGYGFILAFYSSTALALAVYGQIPLDLSCWKHVTDMFTDFFENMF